MNNNWSPQWIYDLIKECYTRVGPKEYISRQTGAKWSSWFEEIAIGIFFPIFLFLQGIYTHIPYVDMMSSVYFLHTAKYKQISTRVSQQVETLHLEEVHFI